MNSKKDTYRELIRLGLPIIFQNLLSFSFGACDSLMLSRLGKEAISSAYIGSQVQLLLQTLTLGITLTVALIGSQCYGRGDTEGSADALSLGLKLSLALGAAATLASLVFPTHVSSVFSKNDALAPGGARFIRICAPSYIPFCLSQVLISAERGIQAPMTGFITCAVGLSVKIFSGVVLIFGGLGIEGVGALGAAYSTVIARACELVTAILAVYVFDGRLRASGKNFLKFDRKMLSLFLKFGAPIMASQMTWAANTLLCASVIGRINEAAALPAVSMTSTISSLALAVISGTASAVGILTAKMVGEDKSEELRVYSRQTERISLVLGLLICTAFMLLRGWYLSLYDTEEEAKALAGNLISILALISVATSYQSATMTGLIKSGGDTAFAFKTDLLLLALVTLPLSLSALGLGMPTEAVFVILKSEQVIKCPIAAIKVRKFDWIKKAYSD